MGYVETVLGYGDNHMSVPLNLLFKPLQVNEPLDEDKLLAILDTEGEVSLTLQDDIYISDKDSAGVLETRVLHIDSVDDFYSLLHQNFRSRNHGCRFYRGMCFVGILVSITQDYEDDLEDSEDLETKLEKAKRWVIEMQNQGRFPENAKLVMRANCCS